MAHLSTTQSRRRCRLAQTKNDARDLSPKQETPAGKLVSCRVQWRQERTDFAGISNGKALYRSVFAWRTRAFDRCQVVLPFRAGLPSSVIPSLDRELSQQCDVGGRELGATSCWCDGALRDCIRGLATLWTAAMGLVAGG